MTSPMKTAKKEAPKLGKRTKAALEGFAGMVILAHALELKEFRISTDRADRIIEKLAALEEEEAEPATVLKRLRKEVSEMSCHNEKAGGELLISRNRVLELLDAEIRRSKKEGEP